MVACFYFLHIILYNACGQKDRKPEGGGGEEPGGPKWREISGRGGGGGVGGSLPVSPYFSYNLKFKSLYTFGYILDLSAEISFFAMVHSTL